MPKIVTDDVPEFLGLVSDLFPALHVPRQRKPHFEQMVKQSTLELRLQPEESFILKVRSMLLWMTGGWIGSSSIFLRVIYPKH